MRKKVFIRKVVFMLFLAFVICSLGVNVVIAGTPTDIPEPSTGEDPIEEDSTWVCKKDPNADVILDLGSYGEYPAMCFKPRLLDEEKDIGLIIPMHNPNEIHPLDQVNRGRRGDILPFNMPANGILFLKTDLFLDGYGDNQRFIYEDVMEIFVDGEKWLFTEESAAIFSEKNGQFIIPKGSDVLIKVLHDLEYSITDYIWYVQIERTYPVKCSHNRIDHETVVDLGVYGSIRPSCNPETNRWSLSFNDPNTIVENGVLDIKGSTIMNFYGGAIVHVIPTNGFVIYNSRLVSMNNPNNFTEEDHIRIFYAVENDIVVPYLKASNSTLKTGKSTADLLREEYPN